MGLSWQNLTSTLLNAPLRPYLYHHAARDFAGKRERHATAHMAFRYRNARASFRRPMRRRFVRRRRFAGARRRFGGFKGKAPRTLSAQAGNIVNTGYRGRKLRGRAYRGALLRDTLFEDHYRSLLTTSFTQVTPAGVNAATKTGLVSLLPWAAPGPAKFWITAGGALPIDSGIAVPTFNDSTIVLRGGRSEVTVGVPGVDACRLRVFLLYVKPGADQGTFNALTNVPLLWDPSHFVDFNESFKLLSSREYHLLPGSRPVSLIFNFRPQKIDWDMYRNGEGHLAYCFTVSQCTDIDILPGNVIFSVNHSVSFTGDVT